MFGTQKLEEDGVLPLILLVRCQSKHGLNYPFQLLNAFKLLEMFGTQKLEKDRVVPLILLVRCQSKHGLNSKADASPNMD
jgi:hypothetical protein